MADILVTKVDEYTDSGKPLVVRYKDNGDGTYSEQGSTTLLERIAGENFDRNVLAVEDPSGYTQFSADVLAINGAGVLKGLFISAASATPSIKIWDSAAASGAVLIDTFTPVAGQYYAFPDVEFATGLYIDITNTVVGTVFWK